LEQRAIKHTVACLLARAVGRSPLEYLNESERDRQTRVALNLIESGSTSLSQLVELFAKGIVL
jgi:hypothetical protein